MIEALRGRSADELAVRLRQAARAAAERVGLAPAAHLPGDAAFLRRLSFSARGGDGVLEHFRAMDFGRVFPALADPRETARVSTARWPERGRELMKRAERLHDGRFDLLGYEGLRFGDPVDWHLDPISGTRSPLDHWSLVGSLGPDALGDPKVIWEINRHQHFQVLARAWALTGDPRHVRLLVRHLAQWMAANPPKRGINWASSLELAYRSIAWLWGLAIARGCEELEPRLLLDALKHLWLQGRHVATYLSTYFSPNTHLTGEALGLLYLGTLLPELSDAPRWRRIGWRILVSEIDRHVLPDGTYFERTSYYHRYTIDIYTHALLLARANGVPAEELARVEDALRRLLHHLALLTRPEGTTPLIGDDDGGHLWFPEPPLDDFRPSLSTGAVLFLRPDLAYIAGGLHEETLWLLGPDSVRAMDAVQPEPPRERSAAFRSGGYYVLRDGWSATSSQMVFDAGPLGSLNCGHAHADALGFDLTVRGRPVLVDPGTYCYAVPAQRDAFRGTGAHNTVTIDGAGSSEPGRTFHWISRADAWCERWITGETFDFVAGAHRGFEQIAPPGEHRREVLFARGVGWMVRDTVRLAEPKSGALRFQLAPGLVAVEAGGGVRIAERSGCDVLQLFCWDQRGREMSGRVEQGWVSRAYGRREGAPRWVVAADPFPERVATLLLPESGRPDIAVDADETGLRLRFTLEQARHVVMTGTGEMLVRNGWETDAEWLWAQSAADGSTLVIAVGASRLAHEGTTLLDRPARLQRFEARLLADAP